MLHAWLKKRLCFILVNQNLNSLLDFLCLNYIVVELDDCFSIIQLNQLTVTGNRTIRVTSLSNKPWLNVDFDFMMRTITASSCCSLENRIVVSKVESFSMTSLNVAVVIENWSWSEIKSRLYLNWSVGLISSPSGYLISSLCFLQDNDTNARRSSSSSIHFINSH